MRYDEAQARLADAKSAVVSIYDAVLEVSAAEKSVLFEDTEELLRQVAALRERLA